MTGDNPRGGPRNEPAAGASSPFDSVVGRVEAQLARGLPGGAVESPPPDEPIIVVNARIYAAGIALGVALLALVVNAWLTRAIGRMAIVIRPTTTLDAFVASPGWRWGSLVAALALCAGAITLARRGRRWPSYVAAALTVVMLAMSVLGLQRRLEGPADSGWSLYVPDSLRD